MPDTIEILDQLYDGHTCSNCLHRVTCNIHGPCKKWQDDIVDLGIKTYPLKAKPHALNVKWTLDMEDLLKTYNTSAFDEMLIDIGESNGSDGKTDNT